MNCQHITLQTHLRIIQLQTHDYGRKENINESAECMKFEFTDASSLQMTAFICRDD
jgi:hypothetical protein